MGAHTAQWGASLAVWRLLAPTLLHLLFLAIFNVLAIAMNTVFLYIYIHTHTHTEQNEGGTGVTHSTHIHDRR